MTSRPLPQGRDSTTCCPISQGRDGRPGHPSLPRARGPHGPTCHPPPGAATRHPKRHGLKGKLEYYLRPFTPANHPVPGLPLIAAALCSTNPLGLRASHCIPGQLANRSTGQLSVPLCSTKPLSLRASNVHPLPPCHRAPLPPLKRLCRFRTASPPRTRPKSSPSAAS